jgi:hypothetical protein
MEATIIVSERKEKAGTGKNGKPYTLITLVAQTGDKYSGFNIDREITPGCLVKLLAKPNEGYRNSYNIERIIEYDTNPLPQPGKTPESKQTTPTKGEAVGMPMNPSISKLTGELQLDWIRQALVAMEQAGLDAEIENPLLVELVREYFSEWMSKNIQAEQRARWGK